MEKNELKPNSNIRKEELYGGLICVFLGFVVLLINHFNDLNEMFITGINIMGVMLVEIAFLFFFSGIDKSNFKEMNLFKVGFFIVNLILIMLHLNSLLVPSIIAFILMMLFMELFITFLIEIMALTLSLMLGCYACLLFENSYAVLFVFILLGIFAMYTFGNIYYIICSDTKNEKRFIDYAKKIFVTPIDESYKNNIYISYLLILISCYTTGFKYSNSIWYELLDTTFIVILAVFQIDWREFFIRVKEKITMIQR